MIAYGWLPSATKSFTTVAVTVCGAFQFVVVKGRAAGASVPFFFNDAATSEVYALSLHGALPISTVKVPVDRSSPVVESVTFTVKPAESLSTLIIDTFVGLIAA